MSLWYILIFVQMPLTRQRRAEMREVTVAVNIRDEVVIPLIGTLYHHEHFAKRS